MDIVIWQANIGKKKRNSLFGGLLLLHGQKLLETDSFPLGPLVHFGGKLDDANTKLPLAEVVKIGKVTLVQVGPEGLMRRTELGLRRSLGRRTNNFSCPLSNRRSDENLHTIEGETGDTSSSESDARTWTEPCSNSINHRCKNNR